MFTDSREGSGRPGPLWRSPERFRKAVLATYRVLGPFLLGLFGVATAIDLGWIRDFTNDEPWYTLVVVAIFLLAFAAPVLLALGVLAILRFSREWPFIAPVYLFVAGLLVIVWPAIAAIADLGDRASEVHTTLATALFIAGSMLAIVVGYGRGRPGP